MEMNKGYYDIDNLNELLVENGLIDELFYMQDLKQRKIYLNTEISQFSVADAVRHILQFNAEDKGKDVAERKPILLYLVSYGGEVDSGFELIDVILNSKTPVYTINLGYQYSMGFLIGIAGHKRFATKNAKYLIHDGSSFVHDSGTKAQDQMAFQGKVGTRIRDYILERTTITKKQYDKNERVEWYMFADEAKERGVVDYIIGEDCSIDEII